MPEKLTPEQALQNIINAIKGNGFCGTWTEHLLLDQSLKTLDWLIKQKENKENE